MKWLLIILSLLVCSRSSRASHLRSEAAASLPHRLLKKETLDDASWNDATTEGGDEPQDDSSTAVAQTSDNNNNNNNNDSDSNNQEGNTSSQRGRVDLVHLVPFNVQLVVTQDDGITTHELTDIVTAWMNKAYQDQLQDYGYTEENRYAKFDGVVLYENDSERQLQDSSSSGSSSGSAGTIGDLYTAKFKGGAVFSRDEVRTKSVPPNDVLLIQQVILRDETSIAEELLPFLQESDIVGLGSAVVDVNAYPAPESGQSSTSSEDKNLEIVIIVAIVVACAAFFFLLAAVFWAYHYDRTNRKAYLAKEHAQKNSRNSNSQGQQDRTDSDHTDPDDSPEKIFPVPPHAYPTVIGGDDMNADSNYPESVISDSLVGGSVVSEDISTSLSQYYKAGMGRVGISNSDYARSNSGMLNDAGSVSSMESYGYSLDEGMSTPMPTNDAPYKKDRERIGGLPVEPDLGDDVQIPDLDQELADLDIKLTPNMDMVDVETYSHQDLENYRSESEEEVYSNLSNNNSSSKDQSVTSPSSSYDEEPSNDDHNVILDPPPQQTIDIPIPIDVDSAVVGTAMSDDDDDDEFPQEPEEEKST